MGIMVKTCYAMVFLFCPDGVIFQDFFYFGGIICFHQFQPQFFRAVPAVHISFVMFFHDGEILDIAEKLLEEFGMFEHDA